jgi:hypothetical protein
MKKYQVLMIDTRRPELEERITDPETDREIISSFYGHGNYMLDIKGPNSRIASKVNMLLGGLKHPSTLRPQLAEQLLNCFSARHYAQREHLRGFLEEWEGAQICSYYSEVQEFHECEDFDPAEPAAIVALSPHST